MKTNKKNDPIRFQYNLYVNFDILSGNNIIQFS
jgi:hypothetical protein